MTTPARNRWPLAGSWSEKPEKPPLPHRYGALGAELLAAETAYTPPVIDTKLPATGDRLLGAVVLTYPALNAIMLIDDRPRCQRVLEPPARPLREPPLCVLPRRKLEVRDHNA